MRLALAIVVGYVVGHVVGMLISDLDKKIKDKESNGL